MLLGRSPFLILYTFISSTHTVLAVLYACTAVRGSAVMTSATEHLNLNSFDHGTAITAPAAGARGAQCDILYSGLWRRSGYGGERMQYVKIVSLSQFECTRYSALRLHLNFDEERERNRENRLWMDGLPPPGLVGLGKAPL